MDSRRTGNKTGRPSAYENIIKPNLDKIRGLKQRGLTDREIATAIGIGYGTMKQNKQRFADLKEALEKGKEELILNIEQSLYKKALGGFTIKTTKRKYIEIDGVMQNNMVEVLETITEQAPDLGAIIFTLTNIAPEYWKNKQDTNANIEELTGAMKDFLNGMSNVS